MEAIRKLVPSLGRSASTILEDDVKEILVASSKHLDRLRDFTRDAALEGRYAELGTRYETLKASPNPSTDEVKELRGDLKKFRDEVSLRKNEAVVASLG
ncbi:hypothetical protein K443DRAFT_675352 [Laccaria amethystina LaAM-08-1]|uniref:Uncharacterized protein n=1 Tax=Laccaria amethystina LaAM-08-1 TaxID=1095629 RepID=A0A0C9WZK4_9AGAR|nr:hypothetical protein K443DRAFT_675352 [Laccaria amethystina LaAM-08-1]